MGLEREAEEIAKQAWDKSVERNLEAEWEDSQRRLRLSNKKSTTLHVNRNSLRSLARTIAQFSNEEGGLDSTYFNGSHTESEGVKRARGCARRLFKSIRKAPADKDDVVIKISGIDILSMESVLMIPTHSAPEKLMSAAQAVLILEHMGQDYLNGIVRPPQKTFSSFIPKMLRRRK